MVARILVISDTHLRADTLDRLPTQVWDEAKKADLILHAGDVMCRELLDSLTDHAPLHAVLGNNDVGRVDDLPEVVELEVEGVSIAMVHDSGARKGRENRMHRRFPAADVVVFGHSHEPAELRTEHGQLLFNPGSPTQRRRQPKRSYGVLVVRGDEVATQVVMLG